MTRYTKDLFERVVATFLQAALAGALTVLAADTDGMLDLDTARAAALVGALAGLTALLSLIKGLLARYVGDSDSAALLPGGDSDALQE